MDNYEKYPLATEHAIRRAERKDPKNRTRHDKIIMVLTTAPTGWVNGLELSLKAGGLGMSARIAELRKSGVLISCRPDPNRPPGENWHQYRLTTIEDFKQSLAALEGDS